MYLIPALEGTSTVFPPPPAATAFLDKPLIGGETASVSVTEKLKASEDTWSAAAANVNVGVSVAMLSVYLFFVVQIR